MYSRPARALLFSAPALPPTRPARRAGAMRSSGMPAALQSSRGSPEGALAGASDVLAPQNGSILAEPQQQIDAWEQLMQNMPRDEESVKEGAAAKRWFLERAGHMAKAAGDAVPDNVRQAVDRVTKELAAAGVAGAAPATIATASAGTLSQASPDTVVIHEEYFHSSVAPLTSFFNKS